MKKDIKNRIVLAILGCIIISLGVGIVISTNLGPDACNVLYIALSNLTPLTVGNWTMIFGVMMIIVAFVLDKKKIGFSTILFTFGSQFIIDYIHEIFPVYDSLIICIIWHFLSILIMSFGCVLCIFADLGLSMYDAFIFSIVDHFKLKYVVIRYISDAIFFVVGYLLGGTYGIGTVMCLLLFGPVIKFFQTNLEKPVKKLFKIND